MRSGWVDATQAQEILECHKSMLFRQIRAGEIPSARLTNHKGTSVKRWIMKSTEVKALRDRGFRRYKNGAHHRAQLLLWTRYFGEVPKGFMPAFRDGDMKTVGPKNLCLLPLKHKWREAARAAMKGKAVRRNRRGRVVFEWTQESLLTLCRDFPFKKTEDIANAIGASKSSVVRKAHELGLKKDPKALRSYHKGPALPISTERVHYKGGILAVKVEDKGTYRQQWRKKHHLVWEQANGRPLPKGYRVVFKDGDNRNFDPDNLVAMTLGEVSTLTNIKQHIETPKPLRDLRRLLAKARREVDRQILGDFTQDDSAKNVRCCRRRSKGKRWTPQMDEILVDTYATNSRELVAAKIGVTVSSVRQRARRLKLQRLPETMIAEARARAAARGASDLALFIDKKRSAVQQ